jgi:hypothetical protein
MNLEAWRDLVIVIWGLIGILASIIVTVVIILLYGKAASLVKSANLVVEKVNDIVDYTDEELIRPIVQLGSMIKGIAEGVSMFSKIFRKKKEEDDE